MKTKLTVKVNNLNQSSVKPASSKINYNRGWL